MDFEIDLVVKDLFPVKVFCDNDTTIKLALNPVFHEKTKHFEVDVHFVRDRVSKGILKIVKIKSELQRADIFTKSLSSKQHDFLWSELGLYDPFKVE